MTVGSGLETSCGEAADDFLLLPKFSWLNERGNRARNVGATAGEVVVAVTVTFDDAVVIIAIRDAVELCGEERARVG